MTLKADIQTLVDRFAADLDEVVRSAAVEAVQSVLGGASPARAARPAASAPSKGRLKPGPKPKAKPSSDAIVQIRASQATAPKVPKVAKRVRRSAADIEATATKIHAFVNSNPGANAETIKKALGIATKEWGGPLGVLIASKRLQSKGSKRSTTYSAR